MRCLVLQVPPLKKKKRTERAQERLSKHRSSLKNQETPPSKDKSISGRRADGFEGRLRPCLRWEASDGSTPLSSGNRVIPQHCPQTQAFQWEPLTISNTLMWRSFRLQRDARREKKDWMWREKSRGRVNISYTYYQTELLISIPSKPPQVMLKRIGGNHGGCEFLLQKGDLNLNTLKKNYREKKKSKTSW